jgi:hypothetical protein
LVTRQLIKAVHGALRVYDLPDLMGISRDDEPTPSDWRCVRR